jgi:hypothetical protein
MLTIILIVLIVLCVAGALGPHTYYRNYSGPPADWLWIVVVLIVLWLLFGNRL